MNSPYLIIPIFIAVLILYFLGFILVRHGIFTVKQHRKIWNTFLLLTFFVAAILGIILAIQINYKFSWPWIKTFLVWHVNFGIAMSIVATIHFFWHFSYYLSLFRGEKEKLPQPSENLTFSNSNFTLLVVLSGFLAISVQVLLIREISTVFHGNELQMAWVMCIWMLLTGFGALLGSRAKMTRSPEKVVEKILLLLCFLPVLFILLLNLSKNSIFSPGIIVSPINFLIIVFIILAPICLLSGIAFSFLLKYNSINQKNYIKVYALEAIGGLVGGILISIILVQWLSVLQSFLAIAILVSALLWFFRRSKSMAVCTSTFFILFVSSAIFPVDKFIKSQLFINQHVVLTNESYNGNITITENAGQFSVFENGSMSITTENIIGSEEFVHFAMLQHKNPEHILLISGGFSGMPEEILKYRSVKEVDCVEPNPAVIKLVSEVKPFPTDNRLNIFSGDGRRFIQKTDKKYDVVILVIPDPTSLLVNRYYTNEFVALLKQKLNTNAVVICGHSTTSDYLSDERSKTESAIFNTLKANFSYVEVIVGEKDYFIASDSFITNQVALLSDSMRIETFYVNAHYLDNEMLERRSSFVKQNIDDKQITNTDTKPLPVFFHTLQYLSLFSELHWYLLVIPFLMLIIPVFFMNHISTGMYVTGFTASSVEILIMFAFQTFIGYLYTAIGLIIALFMAGLAIGAFICNRYSFIRSSYTSNQLVLLLIAGLFPLLWIFLKNTEQSLIQILILFAVTLFLSIFTGFQYVISTEKRRLEKVKSASIIYAADLLGSALGALAITTILLPFIGLTFSCLIIAGMNLMAILIYLWKK